MHGNRTPEDGRPDRRSNPAIRGMPAASDPLRISYVEIMHESSTRVSTTTPYPRDLVAIATPVPARRFPRACTFSALDPFITNGISVVSPPERRSVPIYVFGSSLSWS